MAEIKLDKREHKYMEGGGHFVHEATDGENSITLGFYEHPNNDDRTETDLIFSFKRRIIVTHDTQRLMPDGKGGYTFGACIERSEKACIEITCEHEKQFFLTAMRMLLDVCEK